jgi:hypothetical protein
MTEHHEPQLGVLGPEAFDDQPRRTKLIRNLRRGIPSSILKIYSYPEATRLNGPSSTGIPPFPLLFHRLG